MLTKIVRRVTAVALAGTIATMAAPALAQQLTVTARKTADEPVVDGKPDKVWDGVRAQRVKATQGPQGSVDITIKALYTDTHVFLLLQWQDKTMSQNRVAQFDGPGWRRLRGGEDQMNLIWEIDDSMKSFRERGCAAACHKSGQQIQFRTSAASERLDLWSWRSQRTNPVGYAEDGWLGNAPLKSQEHGREVVQYHAFDPATGTVGTDNWDASTDTPRFTWNSGAKPGPTLLAKDAVAIKPAGSKKGDRLPLETIARPGGSRGDIEARGEWVRGRWTLELKRARSTGDKKHDVQFTQTGKPYPFAISVHEDSGKDEHATTDRTVLMLVLE
jgi:hypothetical protein